MLIQRLQKWWIENPSLLTCVKTIQYDAIHTCERLVWIFNPPFLKSLDYYNHITEGTSHMKGEEASWKLPSVTSVTVLTV
jgi:hypothetical protein